MTVIVDHRFRPLEDRLVCRMVHPDEEVKTAGGLHIPAGAHEKTMFAVVIARGPGRITYGGNTVGRDCAVDDMVLVGKLAGTPFTVGRTNYLVIREADVMVRWEGVGRNVHLPDTDDAVGVDEFFTRRQLPAKVEPDPRSSQPSRPPRPHVAEGGVRNGQ